MGRNIPPSDIATTIHPLLSLAISVAWIAALVATISSLCGIWSKKTSKSSAKDDVKNTGVITSDLTAEIAPSSLTPPIGNFTNSTDNKPNTTTTTTDDDDDDDITTKPLPPPPSAAKLEFGESAIVGNKKKKKNMDKSSSLKNYVSRASTRRKLSFSISMRMSMKIKDKASDFKGKASEFKYKASEFKDKASDYRKAKNDSESLWNKRIILGEKCRRPNGEDELFISRGNNDEQEEEEEEEEEEGRHNDDSNDIAAESGGHSRTTSRSYSNSSLSIDYESNSSLSEDEKSRIDHKRRGKHKVSSDEEDDDIL